MRPQPWLALALSLSLFSCSQSDSFGGVAESRAPKLADIQPNAPVEIATNDAPSQMAQLDPQNPQGPSAPQGRMVIRNATIELRADRPRDALASATKIAEAARGFVVQSDVNGTGDDVTSSTATLRVPSEKFETVLQQLRALGTPLHENISGQDVTAEYIDLDAQLRAQQKLEENFLSILNKAQTVEDTLKVETELSRVRTAIERLQGRTRYLQDQAALSTISFTASAPYQPADPYAESALSRIGRAFHEAGDLALQTIIGLIGLVGALFPVLLLSAPFLFWWRRRRALALKR